MPSSKIWIPDLLLYNSADVFETKANVNAVLESDGTVNFLPPGMFKSTCQIEIYHFPFDMQSCSLKFGSWTYDESNIDLRNKSDTAQLDSYIENGEWLLRGKNSSVNQTTPSSLSDHQKFHQASPHIQSH